MGGSFELFTIGGTAIRIHVTFFLLLAFIAIANYFAPEGGFDAAVQGVVFIVLLFVCVVLHEFGHIIAARQFGIATPTVTVLPIGGVASLERMPEKPGQEIVVALAGPLVNVIIAFTLYALAGASLEITDMARLADMQPSLLSRVAEANVALVIFNLIPAFPMDGGRVLRALLAIPLGFTRATQIAARIGQALAVVLGILGLFGSPLLVLIAVFVFLAASAEAGMVQGRDMTRGILASEAMVTDFQTLSPSSTLDDAAQLMMRTTQPAFPVVDGQDVLRGAVTRSDLIQALREKEGQTPVLDIMRRDVPVVTERTYLEGIFQMLQQQPAPMVAVVGADRRLKGFITRENLADMVMMRSSRRPSTVGSRR
jgi:Zn-dependent protease/CBS domain-containing protein